MSDLTDAMAPLRLELSARDAQFLAAALAVCASIVNPHAFDDIEHNEDMLMELFAIDYSAAEFNALIAKSRTLMPFDARIEFTDVSPTMASPSPLVS